MVKRRVNTRLLVLSGLLTAISIVFSRFFSVQIPIGGIGALRLGFGPLPVIVAGLIGGPWVGAAVGAAADLVGFIINPFGAAFVPHITVVSTLTGMMPAALLSVLSRRNDRLPGFVSYLFSIAVSQIVLHVGAMALILYSVFGVPMQVSLVLRGIAQAILIPVYSVLAHIVIRRAPVRMVSQRRQNA